MNKDVSPAAGFSIFTHMSSTVAYNLELCLCSNW